MYGGLGGDEIHNKPGILKMSPSVEKVWKSFGPPKITHDEFISKDMNAQFTFFRISHGCV